MYYSNGNYIPKKLTDCYWSWNMRRILISHWGSPKNTISEIEARE
mgnify:CR=1 FL=1